MDAHPQFAEAEILDTTKPPTELLPRHAEPECLGEEGLRDDALHSKALGWSPCLLQPTFLQLQEFVSALLVWRI
ncbi:hypothetical protein F0U59_51870 [Archangium gephyra]|nr:hypothetical protein F0U59_51870 [Archangium gephyra]